MPQMTLNLSHPAPCKGLIAVTWHCLPSGTDEAGRGVKVIPYLKSTLEIPLELLPWSRDSEPRMGIGVAGGRQSVQRGLAVRAAAKSEFLLVQSHMAARLGGEKHTVGSIRGREAGFGHWKSCDL